MLGSRHMITRARRVSAQQRLPGERRIDAARIGVQRVTFRHDCPRAGRDRGAAHNLADGREAHPLERRADGVPARLVTVDAR